MKKISLKAARVDAGKTQSELSKEVGVSKNLIIDWEKGRKAPDIEQFYRYCAACNIAPEDVDCKVRVVTRL